MSSLSLRREHRLTHRSEYTRCYERGKKLFSQHFVVFIAQRESIVLPWRFGMAVTKKTGTAVQRNRIRRLIRECFRCWQQEIPLGFDFVVIPKRQVDPRAMGLALIAQELVPLFRKRRFVAEP